MSTPANNVEPANAFPFAWVIGIAGFVDLMIPSHFSAVYPERWLGMPSEETTDPLFVGMLAAQFCLLAVWAALGPSRLRVQLSAAFGVLAGLSLVFLFEMGFEGDMLNWRDARNIALSLPLYWLAAQTPFWVLRVAAGWRIVRPDDSASPTAAESRQVGLIHLLAGVTLTAVALGLAQAAMPDPHRSAVNPDSEAMPPLASGSLAAVVASAVVLLPNFWIALGCRSAFRALIGHLLCFALSTAVICAISWAARGTLPSASDLLVLSMFCLGLALALLVVLRLARRSGYRLVSKGR